MMSMDAEAEMEGLFGGEDQGQDDAAATQSLTQEEREAGEANLDVTGAGGEVGEKKKKTVIRKPIPKLDNDRIMGARGVHTLEELFADFKPRGKGHEFEDLDVVMKKMEHWAHRLFPKLPFNSVLDIIANRLGKRKVVQTHVKKIRLGMLHQPAKEDEEVVKDAGGDEEEREVERYGEGGGENEEEVEDFFANMVGHQASQVLQAPPPVRSVPIQLTDEQKERMRRNKEMAAIRKREKEEREALKKRTREEEDEDEGEIEREMLTGGNASEWGPQSSEVEASCLKTVQELSLQSQQSKKSPNIPSKASECSILENVPSERKEGGEIAPEDNTKKEDTAVKVIGSIEEKTGYSEVRESENDQPNKSPEEAQALCGNQDETLPVEATEDDLSLAQMMEEMEEDDMEGEQVKNPPKEDNVISLDQIMDEMEED